MKKITLLIFGIIVAIILLLSGYSSRSYVQSTPLQITVGNVKNTGNVQIGIYSTATSFEKKENPIKSIQIAPDGKPTITFYVDGLPLGTYAVAVFQDSNNDGFLNKNIFGIPKEPYGFSNNVIPKLSAPNFNECALTYSTQNHQLQIKLIQ